MNELFTAGALTSTRPINSRNLFDVSWERMGSENFLDTKVVSDVAVGPKGGEIWAVGLKTHRVNID